MVVGRTGEAYIIRPCGHSTFTQLSNLVILTLLQLAQVFCYPVNNLSQLALILHHFRSPDREPEYVYRIYSSCLFFTMIGADKDLEE
jgi:hypothetical protein